MPKGPQGQKRPGDVIGGLTYDIKDLVAAMIDAEQPPMILDDAPRGSEVW